MSSRNISKALFGLSLIAITGCTSPQATQTMKKLELYIGTYTAGDSEGIYKLSMNPADGKLDTARLVSSQAQPSFVYATQDGKNLYAVAELVSQDGTAGAQVNAYERKPDGSLALIENYSSGGNAACHVSMDPSERYLFVANYLGGVFKAFARQADGSLVQVDSVNVQIDGGRASHAHAAQVSPEGKYVYVPDLGQDRIWSFAIGEEGKLTPTVQQYVPLDSGQGPRHFTFHPTQALAYVINEHGSTVVGFSYDPENGKLEPFQQISTLPEGLSVPNQCADIHVHPNGKFLYASNRGHNSLAVFELDASGAMTPVEHVSVQGDWPRNFTLDPDGKYLFVANERSDNIVSFRVDQANGTLTPIHEEMKLSMPVCLEFKEN